MIRKAFSHLIFILGLSSCSFFSSDKSQSTEGLKIEAWRAKREESLKAPYGWMSLVGLYWLKNGKSTYTVGASSKSDVVLPERSPQLLGHIIKEGRSYFFTPLSGETTYRGQTLSEKTEIGNDEAKDYLEFDSIRFYLIERSKGMGVRVKDPQSPTLQNFKDLKWYPFSKEFSVKAKFKPEQKELMIPDVLGGGDKEKSAGSLSFKIDGKAHTLWALESGDDLFVIFRDSSSNQGGGSYPSGRFLIVDGPIKENMTIDFNKAYNPPCAYTPWATCPLPPMQNIFSANILAGEAYDKHNDHH
ncbi:DUF1684 domain-containing protein [bacterium]|nr:DUF1684 domain-containing protein [bacterium]